MSYSASAGDVRDAETAAAPAKTRSREHIDYIEYFRALAIILILCGHVFGLAWTHYINEDPTTGVTLLNVVPTLINSGTAYFVFISGFLYRQVFHGRMPFGEFMRRKALYIGLPYLCMGLPIAFAESWTGSFYVETFKDDAIYPESTYVDLVVLMATGRMVNAYWYMPFIFLVFLASPLFDRFLRLKPALRFAIVGTAFAVAMWVHRPVGNLNPFHSFLYFANIYMFGMLFCEYRDRIMPVISRPPVVAALGVLILAIAFVQVLVFNDTGNIERLPEDGWLPLGFDLMLIQKYVGFFLFCGLFAAWGHHAGRTLSFIARNSFGIYFVHAIVIAFLMRLPEELSPHVGEPMTDLAIYASFVLAASIAIILVVKKIAGKYSRYIIGC